MNCLEYPYRKSVVNAFAKAPHPFPTLFRTLLGLKKKIMKTSLRFENAILKLYTAFQGKSLHPEYCDRCAVGNIVDNIDSWQHLTDHHGSGKLNYVGRVNQNFGKRFAGYTPLELLEIEIIFLQACGYQLPLKPGSQRPKNPRDQQVLFSGMCAVISFLCERDGIPNVMDYKRAFENITVSRTSELSL